MIMCEHETPVVVNCLSGHFGALTTSLDLCICNDCGQVYLKNYHHDSTYGEERRDRIEPGQTVAGTTFHESVANLARQILRMTDPTQVLTLQGQLIGIAELAKRRRKRLEELREELIARPV